MLKMDTSVSNHTHTHTHKTNQWMQRLIFIYTEYKQNINAHNTWK